MTLYGALSSSVSGLRVESTAIAVIADNISNVNTVGYKRANTAFATLVTEAINTSSYSSGGVQNVIRQEIDRQGLTLATSVSTDISISGDGFFAVKTSADLDEGEFLYTRAGSFRKDNRGNFVNAGGFYLLAWPLDTLGRLPGEPGSTNTVSSALLESLEVVNVQSVVGSASATTDVSFGINLDASQELLRGPAKTIDIINTSVNGVNGAADIIVPTDSEAITLVPTAAPLNTNLDVGDVFTVSTTTTSLSFTYGGVMSSTRLLGVDQVGPPLVQSAYGATTPTQVFTGADVTTADTIVEGDGVTITIAGAIHNFTYKASGPNRALGEFNSLETFVSAVNEVPTLKARNVQTTTGPDGFRVFVAPTDGKEGIVVTNLNVNGTSNVATNLGILGNNGGTVTFNRFTSLGDLANQINATAELGAEVSNPLSDTNLSVYAKDPLSTISFTERTNGTTTIGGPDNNGAMLVEFGLVNVADQTNYITTWQGNTVIGQGLITDNKPAYDPSGANAPNMAGGTIVPQFSRSVPIFDSLGTRHDFLLSFVKLGINSWGVEIYSTDTKAVTFSPERTDGLVGSGTVIFNGDGSLRSVTQTLSNPISITWTNGALPSLVEFDWGTSGPPAGTANATVFGLTDGLRQFDANYDVEFVEQNGFASGLLSAVEISRDGFVTANFSNGESRQIYKIPLASFSNANGLRQRSGNVYQESTASGNFNLNNANTGGVGTISPASLENSNVDLAEELTNMIVAQNAYQASSKVISTVDELLQDLIRNS